MDSINTLYNTIHGTVSAAIDVVISIFTFETLYASIITSFLFLSRIATYAKIKTAQIYKASPLVDRMTTKIGNVKSNVYSILYNYRIEPSEPNWTNISTLCNYKDIKCSKAADSCCQDVNCCTTRYKLEDIYKIIPENQIENSLEDGAIKYSLHFLDAKTAKLREKTESVDLFTMKIGNSYIIRNIINDNRSKTACFSLTLAKARFISILYSHPELVNPVYIELPKSMYLVGNEILSSTFVLRYLEHQSMPYVFDMRYTLHIIDNLICQFNLSSSQYILVENNGYHIQETLRF